MKKIFEFLINYFLVKVCPKLYMRHTKITYTLKGWIVAVKYQG